MAAPNPFELVYYIGVLIMSFMFGITIGSFLNVCIIRLPLGESLIKRNSHCMTCGTEIKHRDLIPVFSWLFLKGKCRSCGEKISPRYAIVESLTGILFVGVFIKYDVINDGLLYSALICLFIAGLIVLAFQDLDTSEMCVSVLLYTAFIALIGRIACVLLPSAFRGNNLTLIDGLIGSVAVSIPLLIIGFVITPLCYILFISDDHKKARKIKKRLKHEKLSSKDSEKLQKALEKHLQAIKETGPMFGFGMGDIVLIAIAGLMLGWKAAITSIFFAILIGAVAALILKHKNKKSGNEDIISFPFGPYIVIGIILSIFFGTELFDLYFNYITIPPIV